ncbi:unnamed protein product [Blepharisma stoltei]|uniref:PiggyBac transposable element-derived protein domain-containing protein n=1 Tax=Blepharisma stoltei TaxID=1481888 RepID=A0AAU9IV55_9CILI|nr:unnamed protein product [Blepharisma stoltei]
MSKKPIKWEFKVFTLSDSKTGYLWNLPWKISKIKNNIAMAVTLRLIEELRSNWHHLYCDNWYSSPELFRILANQGFGATGTVRKKERIDKVSYKIKWID